MKQQTAVDWIIQWGKENPVALQSDYYAAIEQSKEMEKQQIKDSYLNACAKVTPYGNYTDSAEQYYNETYNK